jgi:membrane-bound acyltransferase YfiQ involved in biofilm formation
MHNQTNVLSSSPNAAAASQPEAPAEPPQLTPAPPAETPLAKAARLANVERLRVLAMLEIVRYHDHNDRLMLVGGLGLPTFLLLTNLFNCTLTHKRGPEKFMQDKRKRLVVPWIFWSLFYGAFLAISAIRHHEPLSETFTWNMILAGTSSHLWFVPFAFASAAAVAGAQHLTRNLPDRATGNVALVIGAVVLIGLGLLPEKEYIAPLPQWLLSTPSTFLGFAFGRLVLADGPQFRVKTALPIAIGALALSVYCALFFPNFLMQRYATSTLLVIAALLVHGKPDRVSTFLSPLLFGIYLVHHFIADRVLSHVPGVAGMPWLFLVDFVITVFVVRALKETPLKRFI